eukprot:CAMPEP_0201593386 /NCGR_PEP_ID=MMETSP0190_2-20130828/191005_1 /ASSEMBLY_ACC=CAM_ASM_000263 /TAXON_ID=37353 /ORGANISM="Rosalina sp." /LENGTH=416 /DNA_ID=CAMNT_0048052551 /DNA_START=181 /DNA_END=1432 /DNA_ORIENTATION=-
MDNLDEVIYSPGRKTWNYMDYLMEQIPGKDNYIANITDELPDGTEQVIHYVTMELFDYLMEQIPGKDNYLADITDELPDGTEQVIHYVTDQTVNAGYYSRFYGLTGADAMGTTKHRRGWADRYLFAAKTTQTKVSPVEFDFVDETTLESTRTISRWSYAVPLEIVYQTPLTSWNPYNISFVDRDQFDYLQFGFCGVAPFNGWTYDNAYFTPSGFFEGITSSSNADTAADNVCALDPDGTEHSVYPSGHWITFPSIGGGVGLVRQRYPIFPIHEEGNTAYKEVKALEDVVLSSDYDDPIANPTGFFGNDRDLIYGFELNLQGGGHQHVVYVPGWQVQYFWYNATTLEYKTTSTDLVWVEGEERNGHAHRIQIWRDYDPIDNVTWRYHIGSCGFGSWSDGVNNLEPSSCTDGHTSLAR